MAVKLSRRDIGYTVISRFEEALRGFIAEGLEVLFEQYEKGVPSGIISKAQEREPDDHWDNLADFLENVDFPDLKEIVCYNKAYTTYFPHSHNVLQMQEFCEQMDTLYVLRCKIAHIRGFFTSLDLDKLLEISRRVALQLDSHGDFFSDFVNELSEHPENVVIPAPIEFTSDFFINSEIPNNLPIGDYEFEGGFVGRQAEIQKVIKMLEGEQVVTIAGAGGVGKTALASKVIEHFLLSSSGRFDGIVWLSAKENKLSFLGIEDIEPTIKNYEQLLDTVLEVMGFPSNKGDSLEEKEYSLKIVSQLYESILIVVDNLETITDEDIVNFILDIRVSHPSIKILITSRKGLGQVERRYELKELKEKEAITLFRLIAKDKDLKDLVKLEDRLIRVLVEKLSCYPLAIKWMIGQVAIGKGIQEVIDSIDETTSDISRFSFAQIYNSLLEPSRKIICALSCFDESPSAGVLSYVVDLEKESLEDGIKELVLVSLVISEQFKDEQEGISTRYVLLPLTRGYVRQQLDKNLVLRRAINERLRTVQVTLEEAERAAKEYKFNLSNMGAVTEEEKVAAMIAQNGFQKYQAGRYNEAYDEYKRACQIAPRFASVYRNWAVMESQEGHLIEADKLMEKASKLNPNDPQIWLVWGNIKRKNDRIQEALEKYEKAYRIDSNDPIIMNALGQAKTRSGDYEGADKLFREAYEKSASLSWTRNEIINLASLAENLRGWADALSRSKNHNEAEEKLKEALQLCKKVVDLDKYNPKTTDLLCNTYMSLGFFYKRVKQPDQAISYFERAIVKGARRYAEIKNSARSAIEAGKLLLRQGKVTRVKSIFSPELQRSIEKLDRNRNVWLRNEFRLLIEELNTK